MPTVTLLDPAVLDAQAHYGVSYDGLVNATSFGQGLVSYGGWQYAAWYTNSRDAMLARRRWGGCWEILTLPHQLTDTDAHDTIQVGVCPQDGTIHIALDVHGQPVHYLVSDAGVADDPDAYDWNPLLFSAVIRDWGGLDVGPVTYPWFLATPDGKLQCNVRAGSSAGGRNTLLEYDQGEWSVVGEWTTETGTYSHNGATSTSRFGYLHGLAYDTNGRLHASGTWREENQAVCCDPLGISNHDTWYAYSDDRGRTWRNDAGTQVGETGVTLLGVSTPGLVVSSSLPPDYALINAESLAVTSTGEPHTLISYVPGRFGPCHPYSARAQYGRVIHARRGDAWTRRELAQGSYRNEPGYIADYPLAHLGRSQLVFDGQDNAYVVYPQLRILAASASSGWTDWHLAYDGAQFGAFGECLVDRVRAREDDVLSVAYQMTSTGTTTGTTPSAFCVRDFTLGG